jgi:hypothetical protein
LREVISVLAALLGILLLVMGIQIFFRVIEMTLADVVEPLLVEKEGAFVVGGVLLHFGHRERVDRAGFDAVSAKDALGDIDVELARVSLKRTGLVFFAHDFDAVRGTGCFTEIAADAAFTPVVVPKESERAPMCIGDRPLLARILERDRAMEHVLERHLHRVPNFVE